ncbi:MAG: hypothetical protein AB7D43_12620, partial [Sulfurimonadaceae bacterium]
KENYSKTYGQKFQTKFENVHWEAVVNLNKEHTIKDVERLVREIEKETGFTAVQISIHRDEGKINEKTGHPIYNLHAHVNFFTLDHETGQQLYRRSISNSERQRIRKEHDIPDGEKIPKELTAVMDKAKLSKLQDITAETLGMERGERGSEAVRLEHKQHKAREKERTEFKKQLSEAQKEAQKLRYTLKEYQDRIKTLEASTDDRRELHALNRAVNKADGEDKTLLLKELDAKIAEFQKVAVGDLLDGYAINDVAQQSRMNNLKALTKENGAQIIEASKVKGFMGADKIDEKKLEENINATLSKHFAEHNKTTKMIETFTKLRDASLSIAKKIVDHVAEKIKELAPTKEHQKETKKGMER